MGNNTTKVVTGVLGDSYNFKGSMNCDLTFKFNKYTGIIELYSSYGEWIGNAYSISSLIELLTKLRNDELAWQKKKEKDIYPSLFYNFQPYIII